MIILCALIGIDKKHKREASVRQLLLLLQTSRLGARRCTAAPRFNTRPGLCVPAEPIYPMPRAKAGDPREAEDRFIEALEPNVLGQYTNSQFLLYCIWVSEIATVWPPG